MSDGYTDREWASAVAMDWLLPDIPVSIAVAKNRRDVTLCQWTTNRMAAAVYETDFGLSSRYDPVDKLSLSENP